MCLLRCVPITHWQTERAADSFQHVWQMPGTNAPVCAPHQCGLRVQALKWQLDWTTAKIRDIPRRERKTYREDLLLKIVKCLELDWLIHNTDVETLQVIGNTEIIHTEASVQRSPWHKNIFKNLRYWLSSTSKIFKEKVMKTLEKVCPIKFFLEQKCPLFYELQILGMKIILHLCYEH